MNHPITAAKGDRVPCLDGFDRERSVGLWVTPTQDKVVLVAPTAGTALLTPAQARQVRDRLDELANQVEAATHTRMNAQSRPDTVAV